MEYRITYHTAEPVFGEVVVSKLMAVHAMIDYCNKWHLTIVKIESRDTRRQKWALTGITQGD